MQMSSNDILKSNALTKVQRNSLKYWCKTIVVPNDVESYNAYMFGNRKYKK